MTATEEKRPRRGAKPGTEDVDESAPWVAAWHVGGSYLGFGDGRPVVVGEELTVSGHPRLCVTGLHATWRLEDALRVGAGSRIRRVLVRGVAEHDGTKLVARARLVIAEVSTAAVLTAHEARDAAERTAYEAYDAAERTAYEAYGAAERPAREARDAAVRTAHKARDAAVRTAYEAYEAAVLAQMGVG